MNSSEVIESFGDDCITRGFSDITRHSYIEKINSFTRWLQNKHPELSLLQVDGDVLKEYIRYQRDRELKTSTISSIVDALNAIFDYCESEELIKFNPVPRIRKRYLKGYKEEEESERQVISIEDASRLVRSIVDSRDRAIVVLFLKTGIRLNELIALDVDSVNWNNQSITLKKKQHHKRSNRTIPFDPECSQALAAWLRQRPNWNPKDNALFLGKNGTRINYEKVGSMIRGQAAKLGIHRDTGELSDSFTPHNCRYWFTAHLRRRGMPLEFIKILRGDVRKDAMAKYDPVSYDELRRSYLAAIPRLGI